MSKRFLYQRFKIPGHILFWMLSVLLLVFIFQFYGENVSAKLLERSLLINTVFAAVVYLNIYVFFPRFLKPKNYIYYIFWLIVSLTLASLILQYSFVFLFRSNSMDRFDYRFNSNLHAAFFFSALVFVLITSFLKLIKDWISMQDLNLKLVRIEQQKLEAELKTLKSQLNPHFLFNSLNNIYSLSLTNSDKVPDLILRLSELMRHIIYESKENFIPLEKEIDFVNNFIALQRIRTSDKVLIDYRIIGKIPSRLIAPLLFEPFIDNAFKHGLPGNGTPDFINLSFNFDENDILKFSIENNFEHISYPKKNSSGIGLENVKRRLKLLYQPHEYKLEIINNDHVHRVILELKLK